MSQPPPTGKRIVSKSKYVRVLGKRVSLASYGTFLMLLAGVSALALFPALLAFGEAVFSWVRGEIGKDPFVLTFHLLSTLAAVLLCGFTIFLSWRSSLTAFDRFYQVEAVIPLTSANTADLPSSGSLVRASAEPVQEQEAVLLRAATEAQERHEEQLLRAAEGPE